MGCHKVKWCTILYIQFTGVSLALTISIQSTIYSFLLSILTQIIFCMSSVQFASMQFTHRWKNLLNQYHWKCCSHFFSLFFIVSFVCLYFVVRSVCSMFTAYLILVLRYQAMQAKSYIANGINPSNINSVVIDLRMRISSFFLNNYYVCTTATLHCIQIH